MRLAPFNGVDNLKQIYQRFPQTSKLVNNFLVLKEQWVYIIFSSGFVNVTKIKNLTQDFEAMQAHLSTIAPDSIQLGLRLENLTASFCLQGSKGFFTKLMALELFDKDIFKKGNQSSPTRRRRLGIEYDFTTFPAIKIFTDVGVGLVFANGKTNIVGCKAVSDAIWIENLIQKLTCPPP